MPPFKPWHATLAIALVVILSVSLVTDQIRSRQRTAQEQASAKARSAANRDQLASDYASKRATLLANAKEAFVDGRPWAVVSMVAPYVDVADSELMSIYRLAKDQETANAANADEDEAAEEKARLAQCRLRLKCWAQEHANAAWTACAASLRAANPDFIWTVPPDGVKRRKFSQFERGPSSATAVKWSGTLGRMPAWRDDWEMVSYTCEYEADKSKVIAVSVSRSGIPWIR